MDYSDRIEKKIDKILEHTAATDVTLGKQQVSIDEHIRRTNILESEISPIKRHVDRINGALLLLGALGLGKVLIWLWPK